MNALAILFIALAIAIIGYATSSGLLALVAFCVLWWALLMGKWEKG